MLQQCCYTVDLFDRDMNKAVVPAPEPLSGASGAGAVPPCLYLKITPNHRADSAAQATKPSTQNPPGVNSWNLPFDRCESVKDRISRIAESQRREACSAKKLSALLGQIVHVYRIDRNLTFYNLQERVKP